MVVEDVMSSSLSTSIAHQFEESEHWLSAADLLSRLDIRPGMTVADIGAGVASYAVPLGMRVGSAGTVFAVEWRPWLMDELRARVHGSDVPGNLRIVSGRAAETHLPAGCCDLVLLADIWHELEHPDAALDEARKILRPDGRMAILNWRPEGFCPPGPPVEHRVSMHTTICTVERKSWSLLRVAEIGSNGYLLVFEMTDESVQS
jgi:ubiquinone/menaquinone biosynthesis C-methylase UbiE